MLRKMKLLGLTRSVVQVVTVCPLVVPRSCPLVTAGLPVMKGVGEMVVLMSVVLLRIPMRSLVVLRWLTLWWTADLEALKCLVSLEMEVALPWFMRLMTTRSCRLVSTVIFGLKVDIASVPYRASPYAPVYSRIITRTSEYPYVRVADPRGRVAGCPVCCG